MKALLPQIRLEPEAADPLERSIHLVDLENLLGSSETSVGDVQRIRGRYDVVAGVGRRDLVVIATGPTAAPAAWFGWGAPAG